MSGGPTKPPIDPLTAARMDIVALKLMVQVLFVGLAVQTEKKLVDQQAMLKKLKELLSAGADQSSFDDVTTADVWKRHVLKTFDRVIDPLIRGER